MKSANSHNFNSHNFIERFIERPLRRFGQTAMLSLALLLPLPTTVHSEQKTVGLTFSELDRTVDLTRGVFEVAGYQALELPSGISLALGEISIPVSASGDLVEVQVFRTRGEFLGAIDPNQLALVDIPTADDNRYDHINPAQAEFFKGGYRAPVDSAFTSRINNGAIRFSLSPFEITADGSVYALSEIKFLISSSSPLTVGPALLTTESNETAPEKSASLEKPTRYLIITNDNLAPEMQKLVDHKNATGIQTEIERIESILSGYTGRDDAERLRNFLIDFYYAGGTDALLAGDETVVPIRYTCYYNTSTTPALDQLMICDLYFADLTGDWDVDGDDIWGEPTHDNPDLTPELRIGRLPISQPAQAQAYVDKLIAYETDPGFGDRSYLERSVIFSSDQMRDYTESGQHAIIASSMPNDFAIDTFGTVESPRGDAISPTNYTGSESVDHLNSGFGIINVIAHGRHDGFVVRSAGYNEWPKSYIFTEEVIPGHGNLDRLEQNGQMGLYVALSCDLAGFDFDQAPINATSVSFVERMIGAEFSGAVAMIANSRWGWVYSSYRLQREFLTQLFGGLDGDPVAAMNASSAAYPFYRDLIYGQNYYGDPTLRIHTELPGETNLTLDQSSWTTGHLKARVTVNGAPLSNQRVLLSSDGVILLEEWTNGNGIISFNYDFTLGYSFAVTVAPHKALVAVETFAPRLTADVDSDNETILPGVFTLQQNYPNPFNPSSTISWSQPKRESVTFLIFDPLGRVVYSSELGDYSAGTHELVWNGLNNSGGSVASGIYFYQIRAGKDRATRKMSLLK